MSFQNLKVGARLYVGFGLVLLLMVILIGIGITQLASIGAINHKIVEKDWVKADAANAINSATRSNARRTLELLITTDNAHVAKIQERIGRNKKIIDGAFETLDNLVYLPEGKRLLSNMKEERSNYVRSFGKVAKLLEEGRRDEAVSMMNAETLPLLDVLQEHITALLELQKNVVVASSQEAQQLIATARNLMLVFGAVACLIGIGASILITRGLLTQLGGEPEHAADITRRIAQGDLTVAVDLKDNDQSSLLHAMKTMRDSIAGIVGQVRSGTDTIATASGQIAAGNLDLSSRTEQQASSLEETAASMEELTSTVKQNADNAHQANALALSASHVAEKGGAVVAQVVDTMRSINDSSRQINDIIGVIDGIAFQTNILALNAAVEAARAGEQGRGFAVVATEVRNLAQRSASAAKEIKTLIGDSVEKVDQGAKLVDQAGVTMEEIVASIRRVTDIMGEISAASREQTAGIEQVNQAISQMDQVTQQNAALVEEAAAAAASLQEQADNLSQVVGVFKLDGRQLVAKPVKFTAPARVINPVAALPNAGQRPADRKAAAPARKIAKQAASADSEWEEF